MRFLYVIVWFSFYYSFRLFYRKIKVVNNSKEWFGRTIYVSNHQGSFMDPLIIASSRKSIVFFMVRADVFKKYLNPFFWALHMLPIYRQRDGVDTKVANSKVFLKTDQILSSKRNILIFGEGFTDDLIQRRLHPIKKGPVRIGFSALEHCDWKYKIYIQGLGVNYTDFNQRGTDVLISAAEPFCLNDFKQAYEENPAKVVSELTKKVESDMKSVLTHIVNPDWADFHEQIMMFTRKGLHPTSFEPNLCIEDRWTYSMNLAHWLNSKTDVELDALLSLKSEMSAYMGTLSDKRISENERYLTQNKSWGIGQNWIFMAMLFPFFCIGLVHGAIPYLFSKKFVESKFKRPVFWASTKMLLGVVITGLFNLPILFLMPCFLPFDPLLNYLISIAYYLSIGIWCALALRFKALLDQVMRHHIVKKMNLEAINESHARITEDLKKWDIL